MIIPTNPERSVFRVLVVLYKTRSDYIQTDTAQQSKAHHHSNRAYKQAKHFIYLY